MNHAALIEYGLEKPGVSLQYPFDPDLPVLFVRKKMFALLGSYQGFPSINLKAEPEVGWLLRQKYPETVLPGYHMNKTHWNTVLLNGTVPEEELKEMVDDSYRLVRGKLPKAERLELDADF